MLHGYEIKEVIKTIIQVIIFYSIPVMGTLTGLMVVTKATGSKNWLTKIIHK